mgnify:CR=1 FL=1
MARVLVIADLHLPATHPEYYNFIKKLKRKYKTTHNIFIGDVVDHHAISFHKKNPEAHSALAEYKAVQDGLKKWKGLLPYGQVMIGNHDERVNRLNAEVGIPPVYLKDYEEVWDTPTWSWEYVTCVDGVNYTHGTGTSGMMPAFNNAKLSGESWVMGHTHSVAGISWLKTQTGNQIFGMNVGSGVDSTHCVMNYAKNHIKKPILSAGVVIDGHPYLEVMDFSI